MKHWSDCAVHREPAYPAGPCNCGGIPEDGEGSPIVTFYIHRSPSGRLYVMSPQVEGLLISADGLEQLLGDIPPAIKALAWAYEKTRAETEAAKSAQAVADIL